MRQSAGGIAHEGFALLEHGASRCRCVGPPLEGLRSGRPVTVDIEADLNAIDETGFVWTLLEDARDPDLIHPRAIAIAGDREFPAVAEVMDVVERSSARVVHLPVLPGRLEDYETLVRRARARD